ncbi:glycosyl hydrolase family 20, catalytic domain protein [Ancylostoma caninum]|uniref:beta-N-acetylhexosaminidase n=1 Tax=Ancylostoma caninum TaxID=29170 RepID=A0A368G918_ANCCA|nr:glycosyl hydrolase family 20, catalytic domain protein [Ancylostoma caninum]
MDLLDLVARSGATGILLEWEDMFPWTGQLEVARSSDAYSMDDVRAILSKAKSLDLDIIPLVQTFGHLEWFLKLEQFRKYRENDAYPQVLCLGDTEGVDIVKDALKQVIDVHKEFGIKYFHIGADEAFEFGVCEKSREWIDSKGPAGATKQLLALTHMKSIAEYVKRLTGSSATVLAWHDMLKDFDSRMISELGLGKIIEPVIWDYSENIVTMPDAAFSMISTNFPVVWASSAYKGANFPSAKYIDIRHYETNNRAWIETKAEQEKKFNKFHGIIITGWQRYDHMAAICEILPMGTPSMVLNVQIALMGRNGDQRLARDRAARVLGCSQFHVGGLDLISNSCNFTGFTVYSIFQGNTRETIEYIESELAKNHHIMGWLSPYSMRHNFTQNWYLNQIQFFISNLQAQMVPIEHALRRELSTLFFQNTVDEFLYLTIAPTMDRLKNYLDEIKRLSQLREYPKRPFRIAP